MGIRLESKIILVLGMHRSGTSAVTRVLNLLGAELGERLLTPSKDNEKGFWENAGIVELNDQLLNSYDRSWDDPREIPLEKNNEEKIVSARQKVQKEMVKLTKAQKLTAIKDPRLCRLAPLYFSVLEQMSIEATVVLMVRDPLQVARSLQVRNGLSIETGLLLWLRYTLDAEKYSQNINRTFISYDALMDNWQEQADKVGTMASITWPKSMSNVSKRIDNFLDNGLNHQRDSIFEYGDEQSQILSWSKEVYGLLRKGEKDSNTDLSCLEKIREQMRAYAPLYDSYMNDIRNKLARLQNLEEQVTDFEKQYRKLQIENEQLQAKSDKLDAVLSSKSWKSTVPFRVLAGLIRYKGAYISASSSPNSRKLVRAAQVYREQGFIQLLNIVNKKLFYTKPGSLGQKRIKMPSVQSNYHLLKVKSVKVPKVSIIIPVYNKFEFTHACINSIIESTNDTQYEIIVVDDCSTDTTQDIEKYISGIKLIRNEKNLGFIGSCNAGSSISDGGYILFLNNDTVVRPQWLSSMLDVFNSNNEVGLVGSKLIYADGRLQEAGGVIWDDASGWNYGRLDSPDKPEYNYLREVDYCSGACILIKSELFSQLERFDDRYMPAYYEDVDLAFAVRSTGKKVIYQPASEITHFEGISAGTDLSSGMKRYQVVNREKFLDKWKDVLINHHRPGVSPNLAKDRLYLKKVLVIDSYTPMPDKDAGSLRMHRIMQVLVEQGAKVSFLPENRSYDRKYTPLLQRIGVEAQYHPYLESIEDYLKKQGLNFDTVIISRRDVAIKFLTNVKKYCSKAKIVFDTVDLHFVREARESALKTGNHVDIHKSANLSTELKLARLADAMWVVSEAERQVLAEIAPDINVEVISLIHDVEKTEIGRLERDGIVFIGNFLHPPNADAVRFFIGDILPLVRKQLGNVKFSIIGANPPKELKKYAKTINNLEVTGFVDDITPYLNNAVLSVAPLRFGAGVKGKISSSMSIGLPVVTTSVGAEGMNISHHENAMIGDDAASFANSIIELYQDHGLWEKISQNGYSNIDSLFSFDKVRVALRESVF